MEALGERWTIADAARRAWRRAANVPIDEDLRPLGEVVARIAAVDLGDLDDDALAARARAARERAAGGAPEQQLLAEVFAIAAEASARRLGLRPFDVQLAAGVALHRGRLIQLATGEGKTLVAVPAAILAALTGRGVHILTANDFLARRDADWMGPVYRLFGLEVAAIGQPSTRDERRRAYGADITYLTAKEAGFDFLRDSTAAREVNIVRRRPFHFAIVDEADFLLIDEARVPLVIAGTAPELEVDRARLVELVRELEPGVDYNTDEYSRNVILTESGLDRADRLLGVKLQDPDQQLLLSGVHVALHAEVLLRRDRDYIVRDGRVELVDELTGRVAPDRRWPHGIQQAVEAKEAVPVQPEGRILGSIPVQHFLKLYPRLAGMTATAVPAAQELKAFFGLTTVVFPPNIPCRRVDEPDMVFSSREAKQAALAEEIATVHATGRPILVGTTSVAESEALAAALLQHGVSCQVLNARHDEEEAEIVARAGAVDAVTISTNMAGRGTDILLGAGDAAARERVMALGGLYVIGTNRHESRRIDDQLRGRAGRQGDPGTSRFFISLEDDLIHRYGVVELIPASHRPAPDVGRVNDPVVRREIARAQRIIEGQHFDIRRTLWRYSQVVDEQRRHHDEHRRALLSETDAPGELVRAEASEAWTALAGAVGEEAVREAARRVALHALDRCWADHLALIEDIREGVHLQRYGGREPIDEFHKQIVAAYGDMVERARDAAVELFRSLEVVGGAIDLEAAGIRGTGSTWTYLVSDDPFSTFGGSLLRGVGGAAVAGYLAAFVWPITMVMSVAAMIRRRLRRRHTPRLPPPGETSDPT